MKIREIEFKNFRSFRGVKTISFEPDEKKNINMIFARNFSGKTNVMNSVLWALHGKTTEAFKDPHLIVNKDVGGYKQIQDTQKFEYTKDVSAYVQIKLEHNKSTYAIKREITSKDKKTKVSVQKIVNGNWKRLPSDASVFINKLVPESMSELFIFDGERAESLMEITNKRSKAQGNVKQAIRTVLGCETADTAISLLKDKEKIINNKILAIGGENVSSEVKEKQNRYNQIYGKDNDGNGEIGSLEDKLSAEENNEIEIREELNTLNTKALRFEGLENYLSQKKKLTDAYRKINEIKIGCDKQYREWLSTKECIDHLMKKPGSDALEVIKENDERKDRKPLNHFPAPHGPKYIESILSSGECICGKKFKQKDEIYHIIQKQLLLATDDKSSTAYTYAKNYAETHSTIELSLDNYNELKERRLGLNQSLNDSISNIKQQGEFDGDDNSQDAQNLKEEIDKIEEKLRKSISIQIDIKNEIEDLKVEAEKLMESVEELNDNSVLYDNYVKERSLISSVREYISKELNAYEDLARNSIQRIVQNIITKYFDSDNEKGKGSKFFINEDYSIRFDTDQINKTKSDGLEVFLALSFTSALIQYCKGRENLKDINEDSENILLPGIEIPLIIDSPFAKLDEEFRGPVAKIIKETGVQVIFCVSMAQFPKEVKDTLKDNVKNVWGLQYSRLSSPPKNASSGKLTWGKEKIESFLFNKDYEETLVHKFK